MMISNDKKFVEELDTNKFPVVMKTLRGKGVGVLFVSLIELEKSLVSTLHNHRMFNAALLIQEYIR